MATWIGTLARGGVIRSADADAGAVVAAYVVGEGKLDELRTWLSSLLPDQLHREQRAAIEVCIWMACADRELGGEERAMLREIVQASGLPETDASELLAVTEAGDLPSLKTLAKRLTHPVLRELMLALAWELACADGRIARAESDFYTGLAKRLEVDPARAEEIRESVSGRI